MYNNEFEKKVGLRMEELSFSPSDSVWQKVELQIRQRKRRRRLLFWWMPLGLLCLGTAGWFLYNGFSSAPAQKPTAIVNNHLQNTESASSPQPVTSSKKEQVVAEDENNKQTAEAKEQHTKTTEPAIKQNTTQVQAAQQTTKKNHPLANVPVVAEKKEQIMIAVTPLAKQNSPVVKRVNDAKPLQPSGIKKDEVKTGEVVVSAKQEEKKTDATHVVSKEEEQGDHATVSTNNTNEEKTEIVKDASIPGVKTTDVAVTNNPQQTIADSTATVTITKPVVQKPASPNKKKVEWFARFGTGISDMSQFSTAVFAPFAADAYSSGSSSSVGGGTVYNRQSPVKPGVGFSAGVELRTIAKKRSSFSAGLNYAYYSTSLKTGSTVYANTLFNVSNYNSYVNNYMRAGDSVIFHNHYNFFELPFLYHLRLSKQHKRPLGLNTGLSYNYMFASNANYYSKSSGAYYYDKSLFNHSQLHFKLGISSSFIKKENYPLQVGLQYQFGMTGIWKQSLTLNQHLTYTGIEVLWRLHK